MNNIIHIPPALVLGCNTSHGICVLSDWIEEQTGHPPDFHQSGCVFDYSFILINYFNSNYSGSNDINDINIFCSRDGNGYGDGKQYGNGNGDGWGYGLDHGGDGNDHGGWGYGYGYDYDNGYGNGYGR